mmetsp:Transcript_93134/g.221549  ORF Transcript_93134/g.221549 Transcript_93134/m.221549 type:complete len:294 (+) Transcript_93134:878-1759(+)
MGRDEGSLSSTLFGQHLDHYRNLLVSLGHLELHLLDLCLQCRRASFICSWQFAWMIQAHVPQNLEGSTEPFDGAAHEGLLGLHTFRDVLLNQSFAMIERLWCDHLRLLAILAHARDPHLLFQLGDLTLQARNQQTGVQLLIHAGIVGNLGDPLGKTACRDGLGKIGGLSSNAANHGGSAISSQGVPEHAGHHGISVGDMHLGALGAGVQSYDHTLQVVERQVDSLGFLQQLAIDPSLRNPLTPGQIHQVELGATHNIAAFLRGIHPNDEEAMRASTRIIHWSFCHDSVCVAQE